MAYSYVTLLNGIFSPAQPFPERLRSPTKSTEFGNFGVSRYETKFTKRGRGSGGSDWHLGCHQSVQPCLTPNFGARLAYGAERACFSRRAARSRQRILFDSTSTNVTTGYSYAGLRRWSRRGRYVQRLEIGRQRHRNYSLLRQHGVGLWSPHATRSSKHEPCRQHLQNYNKWRTPPTWDSILRAIS